MILSRVEFLQGPDEAARKYCNRIARHYFKQPFFGTQSMRNNSAFIGLNTRESQDNKSEK